MQFYSPQQEIVKHYRMKEMLVYTALFETHDSRFETHTIRGSRLSRFEARDSGANEVNTTP